MTEKSPQGSQEQQLSETAIQFVNEFAEFLDLARQLNVHSDSSMAELEMQGILDRYNRVNTEQQGKIDKMRSLVTSENKNDLIRELRGLGHEKEAAYISRTMKDIKSTESRFEKFKKLFG